MRFAYFNDFRLGVLKSNNIVDITEHLSDTVSYTHLTLPTTPYV